MILKLNRVSGREFRPFDWESIMGSGKSRIRASLLTRALIWMLTAAALLVTTGQASATGVAVGRTQGSFAVSSAGAASYGIPIWTPPGIHGVQPSLALAYSSGSGDGLFGVGWNLAGLSNITRCPKTYLSNGIAASPNLTNADIFCLDGNKLRSFAGTTYGQDGAQYQTEIADFSLVISHGTAGTGPAWFEVHGKNGLIYQYGNTADSALLATGSTSVIQWALNRVSDRFGNHLDVVYINDTTDQVLRPSTITYTTPPSGASGVQTNPNYQVSFTYEARSAQTPSGYVVGASWSEPYLVQTITVGAFNGSGFAAARTYNLTYLAGLATNRAQLQTVQECSPTQCYPSTTVTYQSGTAGWASAIASTGNLKNFAGSGFVGDLNGDGFQDLVYPDPTSGHWYYLLGSGSGNLGGPYDTGVVTTTAIYGMDFNGDGKTDLLLRNGSGNWRVMFYQSPGAAFTFTDTTAPAPNLTAGFSYLITGDVDGDGREDVIYIVSGGSAWTTNDAVYYQLNTGGSFGTPQLIFTTNNVAGSGTYNKLGQFAWAGASHIRHPDFNGDGRVDFFIPYRTCSDTDTKCAAGKGITNSVDELWVSDPTGLTYSVRAAFAFGPIIGDYNGDGCSDIAYPSPTAGGYYWALQYGTCDRNGASSILSAPVITTTVAYNLVPMAIDWDGDGMDDIVETNGSPSGTWGYARSTGGGLGAWTSLGIPFTAYSFALAADVTGDGLWDIVYPAATTYQPTVLPHNGATITPDLATSFTDGFGIRYSPSYLQLTNTSVYTKGTGASYPEQDYQRPRTVVASYSASNGVGGSYTVTEAYSGAKFNVQGLGFEGFSTLKAVDSRTGIETDSSFSLAFPNMGMLSQKIVYQPGAVKVIASVVNTNTSTALDSTVNNQRWFRYISQSVNTQNEVGGSLDGAPITQVTTQYTYSGTNGFAYGNPSQISHTIVDRDSTSPWTGSTYTETFAVTPYEVGGAGASGWCIHLPSQVVTTRTQPSGSQAHTTSYAVNASGECEIDSQTYEPASSIDKVLTGLAYDACGNVDSVSVTGSNPDGTAMATRTTGRSFGSHCIAPETVTNPLLQVSSIAYRYDLGLPASMTDPNGLTTSWTYNDIGQKVLEQRSDGTQSGWTYTACASPSYCGNGNLRYGVQRTENDSTSSHAAFWQTNQYFDQLDRLLYVEPQQSNGVQVTQQSTYDALGRLVARTNPYGNGFSSFTTTYTYDLLNRKSSKIQPNNATDPTLEYTYYGYRGRTRTLTDPNHYITTMQSDVLGRLGFVIDPDGVSETVYTYGPFGQLASIRDPAGNLATRSYDPLGYLLTGSTDSDRGSWTFQYDSLGELLNLRDAKTAGSSWTQSLSYDALGRTIQRIEAEGTTVWTWGTAATAHEIGQLKQISGLGDTETYTYDSAGRVAARSMIWGGNTYTASYNYNTIGKLNQLTYPLAPGQSAPFAVQYSYSYGYPSAIQKYTGGVAGTVFWQLTPGAVNMDPWGHVVDETLGTSTPVRIQSAYDAVTSLLSTHAVGSGGTAANLQSTSYQWDPNGNLHSREDLLQSLTEAFTYDGLNRLQTSALNGTQNLAVSIDSTGNISSRTEGGVTYQYTYDPIHSHAVDTVGAGANQTSYSYDANGNMATRNGASLTWASYNLPTAINGAGGASAIFTYGPDRQRKQQVANYVSDGDTGTETTVYAFGLFESETTSYQQHSKYFISTPSGTQILYDIPSRACPAATYITADHLGSGSLFLNNGGSVILSESFAAYGSRRSSTWSGPLSPTSSDYTTIAGTTRRGYTDGFHEFLDNLSLIHMNGRVYDPAIGRFLSPDPQPGNSVQSQSWNPYAYVMNRPLTVTDPTGLSPNFARDGSVLWDFASFGQETQCYGSCGGSPNYYGGLSLGNSKGSSGSAPSATPSSSSQQGPSGASSPASSGVTSTGVQAGNYSSQGSAPRVDYCEDCTQTVSSNGFDRGLVQVAESPVVQERIRAVFDAVAEIGSNKTKWAQVGAQGESAALDALTAKGYQILAQQLYVLTPAGVRVTDFLVTGGPAGDDIAGFEVKVNDSPYTPMQQMKDSMISGPQGGTVINWSQPAFSYGTIVHYRTYLMTVDMEVP